LELFSLKKLIISVAIAVWVMFYPAIAEAANLANGAKIFNANCSACHVRGNNIIINSKTLKKEALERYGMYSLEAIKTQVTQGKNAMPSFNSRLNPDQIEDVAAYVLSQSAKDWSN
jgi:cytochrome c6